MSPQMVFESHQNRIVSLRPTVSTQCPRKNFMDTCRIPEVMKLHFRLHPTGFSYKVQVREHGL
jgi:hypothetical protein